MIILLILLGNLIGLFVWDYASWRRALGLVLLSNLIPIGFYLTVILLGILSQLEKVSLVLENCSLMKLKIPTYCFMPSWFLPLELREMQKQKWTDWLENHRDTDDEMEA